MRIGQANGKPIASNDRVKQQVNERYTESNDGEKLFEYDKNVKWEWQMNKKNSMDAVVSSAIVLFESGRLENIGSDTQ